MEGEEMLNEIENLLAKLFNNIEDLHIALLKKYSIDVSDEQYLNDTSLLEYWNKEICKFLGKKD
jgi:hypothetical protein